MKPGRISQPAAKAMQAESASSPAWWSPTWEASFPAHHSTQRETPCKFSDKQAMQLVWHVCSIAMSILFAAFLMAYDGLCCAHHLPAL